MSVPKSLLAFPSWLLNHSSSLPGLYCPIKLLPHCTAPGGASEALPDDISFVEAVRQNGRDFRALSRVLNMKGPNAAKHHYYKHRARLGLDAVMAEREAAALLEEAGEGPEEAEMEAEVDGGELEGMAMGGGQEPSSRRK